MLSEARIASLLRPFELSLSDSQASQVKTYLEILFRWNRAVNLTAIRDAEECVTRNFGESFYLATLVDLQGHLLDIGSGAGFPGLALKILQPSLAVILLEPVTKKRAFLKEAVRACGMTGVVVAGDRVEEFSAKPGQPTFDFVTARAVGELPKLIPSASRCLKPGGRMCLWLGSSQVSSARGNESCVNWQPEHPIPLSRERVILIGTVG